ncbi:MAG: TonB-dependent receptor plug domain-containing protein, partial [Phenylobacterium sp.]|nr:TonB-dependent receptor plug domain-containing protein [Phenylobacterium sp.]
MTRTLRTLLLAGAALTTAHSALAQTAPPSEGTEVEEIIVSGRFIPDVIRDTAEVANFLSVEDVQRAGDDNAAQALTRITGISLVSGKFVYVRGLGERYSQALLNGSPLPSPEPLQRVIPLDLFPASILAGTVIQKTFSANYPGEFGGGVIDLQTVGTPDEAFLKVGVGLGGDTETTGKSGLTYYGSETDWLGFDDGTRKLPVGVRQFAASRPVVVGSATGGLTTDQYKAVARSFTNAPLNVLQRDKTPLNGNFDISGGQSFDTDYGRLGAIGVLSYRNGWQTRKGVRQTTVPDSGGLALATDATFEANQND